MLWLDARARARACSPSSPRTQATRVDPTTRCRARQDPARDAQGRDGGARRGAVRALLRQRRQHAALRHARRVLLRAHRRSRVHPLDLAQYRARRWPGCATTAIPTATAFSNTTGARTRACPIRAGRTRTIRSSTPTAVSPSRRSRWSRCRATPMPPGAARRCSARALGDGRGDGGLREPRPHAAAALRGGLLVPGDRHLRAGARRRQAAVPRAQLECRPRAVRRASPARRMRRASPRH